MGLKLSLRSVMSVLELYRERLMILKKLVF